MNYDGPGKYRHHRDNDYNGVGVGEHESTRQLLVVYTSDSLEHTMDRAARGADFVLRPLNATDGDDPWNSDVGERPRFRKLTADEIIVPYSPAVWRSQSMALMRNGYSLPQLISMLALAAEEVMRA